MPSGMHAAPDEAPLAEPDGPMPLLPTEPEELPLERPETPDDPVPPAPVADGLPVPPAPVPDEVPVPPAPVADGLPVLAPVPEGWPLLLLEASGGVFSPPSPPDAPEPEAPEVGGEAEVAPEAAGALAS
jgi:hypothetical protein